MHTKDGSIIKMPVSGRHIFREGLPKELSVANYGSSRERTAVSQSAIRVVIPSGAKNLLSHSSPKADSSSHTAPQNDNFSLSLRHHRKSGFIPCRMKMRQRPLAEAVRERLRE